MGKKVQEEVDCGSAFAISRWYRSVERAGEQGG